METYGADVIVVSEFVPIVVSRRELQTGVSPEEVVEEVLDEFHSSLDVYGDRNAGPPIRGDAPVYFTGGYPFGNPTFLQSLRAGLDRDLFLPEPPMEFPDGFHVVRYMVNVGLALKTL